MSEWISLRNRYPEPGKYYLFINGNHLPFIGMWEKDYGCIVDDELCRPTHWMKLPEPPKDDKVEVIPMPSEAPSVVEKRFEERSGRMTDTND